MSQSLTGRRLFFRPFGACSFLLVVPTACAVGCILSPLRGWMQDDSALLVD